MKRLFFVINIIMKMSFETGMVGELEKGVVHEQEWRGGMNNAMGIDTDSDQREIKTSWVSEVWVNDWSHFVFLLSFCFFSFLRVMVISIEPQVGLVNQ